MTADPAAPALAVGDLGVRYGGVHALDGLTLTIGRGERHGLIGPNGAGKTTAIDAICGFASARGWVRLAGTDVSGLPPHRRARLGLVRTFQGSELFDDLDVAGNLAVGSTRPSAWRSLLDVVRPGRAHDVDASPAAARAADLLDLRALAGRTTTELSEGERKLVGLGRALACDPAVLLLDEPAAGLDTAESRDLGDRLRAVSAAGVAVLLVDHDVDLVLSVCDTVHVLVQGRLVASGPPEEVRRDPQVVAAYLGTAA